MLFYCVTYLTQFTVLLVYLNSVKTSGKISRLNSSLAKVTMDMNFWPEFPDSIKLIFLKHYHWMENTGCSKIKITTHILWPTVQEIGFTVPPAWIWMDFHHWFRFLPSATKLRRLCFYKRVSVHRGEYLTRYTPRTRYTPPWDQVHPLDQVHPPGTRYPPTRYPLGPGTHPPDQVHPSRPGIPPRYGHCCGRYASYWNAFLLSVILKCTATMGSYYHYRPMFSVVSVHRGYPCTGSQPCVQGPGTIHPVQGRSPDHPSTLYWALTWTYSNVFILDLTVHRPPPPNV